MIKSTLWLTRPSGWHKAATPVQCDLKIDSASKSGLRVTVSRLVKIEAVVEIKWDRVIVVGEVRLLSKDRTTQVFRRCEGHEVPLIIPTEVHCALRWNSYLKYRFNSRLR